MPGGMPAPAPKTSVMSIISLITGILGILACGCFVFQIAAVVLGLLGKKEIDESNGAKTGAGMAKAGLILGIVGLVLGILYWILIAVTDFGTFEYSSDF